MWPSATDPSLLEGPPLRGISKVGIGIALIGYLVMLAARGNVDWHLAVIAWIIIAAGVAVAVPRTSFSDLGGRRKMARPKGHTPVGGACEPLRLGPRSAIEGVVQRADDIGVSPVSKELCLAFAISLENPNADRSPILLRDAATLGFAIATDEDTIVVPRGPIDIVGEPEPADDFNVRLYLALIDREHESAEGPDPFPFETAKLILLREGDRVRLHNSVRAAPDPDAVLTGYRELPSRVMVPVGLPRIEIV